MNKKTNMKSDENNVKYFIIGSTLVNIGFGLFDWEVGCGVHWFHVCSDEWRLLEIYCMFPVISMCEHSSQPAIVSVLTSSLTNSQSINLSQKRRHCCHKPVIAKFIPYAMPILWEQIIIFNSVFNWSLPSSNIVLSYIVVDFILLWWNSKYSHVLTVYHTLPQKKNTYSLAWSVAVRRSPE